MNQKMQSTNGNRKPVPVGRKVAVELTGKIVRLWSGMADGEEQEVSLRAHQDEMLLDLRNGGHQFTLTLLAADLRQVIDGNPLAADGQLCSCRMEPSGDLIRFTVTALRVVRFSLPTNQFAALIRGLGIGDPA